jgi:enolase
MAKLAQLYAREILDSRSDPTVEVVAILDDGSVGVSSVPSGASTGTYEAHELRDMDMGRYLGQGVLKAVGNVNTEIATALVGQEITSVADVDQIMIQLDGTPTKSRLGANAILGVSMALTKVLATSVKMPLYRYIASIANVTETLFSPVPLFNMINGGKHGAGNLDFQEFFVIPSQLHSFAASLQTGSEIYHAIKQILARRGAIHSVGDEGGFAPNLFTNLDALEVLTEAIVERGHKPGVDVELGLDVAANSFYKDGRYIIKDRSGPMEGAEFIDYMRDLNAQYHLRVLEDPLHEDDWRGWAALTSELGGQLSIVGDDLLVTNKDRVAKGIAEKACNSILVKPNQIGTVSETIEVVKASRAAGWKVVVSHRSGETNDTFISDFAVGVGAEYVKFGAPARGERVAKYNRLLSIEQEIKI